MFITASVVDFCQWPLLLSLVWCVTVLTPVSTGVFICPPFRMDGEITEMNFCEAKNLNMQTLRMTCEAKVTGILSRSQLLVSTPMSAVIDISH